MARRDKEEDNDRAIQLPTSDSAIVAKAKKDLLGTLDLEALVDDLGRLGNCVRIAYHAVTGHVDLQIEIQQIGYDVTKLCSKSGVTVQKFKKASASVCSTLKCTYELLMDSFEDMALETLARVAETAKGMAEEASTLNREFDQAAEKVITALVNTMKTKDEEEKVKERLQKDIQNMEAASKKQQQLADAADTAQKNAQQLMRQADERQQEAEKAISDTKEEQARKIEQERIRRENENIFRKIVNFFTSNNGSTEPDPALLANLRTNEEKARAARQERQKHLQIMYEQQTLRSQALAELAEFAKRIQNTENDKTQVEAAISALQNAIKALRNLSSVMYQAANFWLQLQTHCESMTKIEFKHYIEKAMEYPEEKRIRFWQNFGLKTLAAEYYAGWLALHDVCSIYMDRIQLTQSELFLYIKEALSKEEARETVTKLARLFLNDIESQQKLIADRKKKNLQEIDDIKAKVKELGQA